MIRNLEYSLNFSENEKCSEKITLTVCDATEKAASDKSSENIPAWFKTSCLRLTISQM